MGVSFGAMNTPMVRDGPKIPRQPGTDMCFRPMVSWHHRTFVQGSTASPRTSYMELCYCKSVQAFEQLDMLLLIWNFMAPVWRHCNELSWNIRSLMLFVNIIIWSPNSVFLGHRLLKLYILQNKTRITGISCSSFVYYRSSLDITGSSTYVSQTSPAGPVMCDVGCLSWV